MADLPTVAIVGRPNVGKSALFNCLVRKRIAIVHDQPGVTRDRLVADCLLGSRPFTVVDTGGIEGFVGSDYVNNSKVVSPDSGLLLRIYPAGSSGFIVHDDTDIQCIAGSTLNTVTISTVARPIVLQVLTALPQKVIRDGADLTQFMTEAELASVGEGWRFESPTGFLFIKIQHHGGKTTVVF